LLLENKTTHIQTQTTMKLVTAAFAILLAAVSAAANDSPTIDGEARKLQPRIINGTDAPVKRYPYTVSLQAGDFHFHICGGSLIAPDLVISAAHCFSEDSTRIVLNPHKLSDPIEASEVFSAKGYLIHPFYQTLTYFDHDYMIIKLSGSSSLPTVRLNTNENLPATGSSLQVMGWGATVAEFADPDNTLQEVDVVPITNEKCSKKRNGVTPDMLCTTAVNKGSCNGDSGGPLVILGSSPEEDVQVGVVSWTTDEDCADPERKLIRRVSSCSAFSTNLTDSSAAFLVGLSGYARIEEEFDWIRFQVCRLSSNPPEYFLGCDEGGVTFSPAHTSAPSGPTLSPAPSRDEVEVLVSLEYDQFGCQTT
jgi:secreted trypsin-like serine protease